MAILFGWILSHSHFWKEHTNSRIVTFSTAARKCETEAMIHQLMDYCRVESRLLVLDLEEERRQYEGEWPSDQLTEPFLLNMEVEKRYAICNHLMQKHCRDTATIFFPIVPPPDTPDQTDAETYLRTLSTLSHSLPAPIVMVRGSRNVVTSEL